MRKIKGLNLFTLYLKIFRILLTLHILLFEKGFANKGPTPVSFSTRTTEYKNIPDVHSKKDMFELKYEVASDTKET